MSKTFAEWKKERRTTITLPSGIEAELRLPSGFKLATLGPLPMIESTDDGRGVAIARRYIDTCLVRLSEERDPISRGLIEPDDFTLDDVNAIVDAVISLMPKREVVDEAVPLADTVSPQESPVSLTE
ncbi:MAG: hypothetical protein M1377_06685 [Deltaproteobacteria bacterium]|nr:hypothetical protein [Deltaproteobacteria bacterium]